MRINKNIITEYSNSNTKTFTLHSVIVDEEVLKSGYEAMSSINKNLAHDGDFTCLFEYEKELSKL